ncbi:hypothetical protein [Roseobacter cerasinus]|uniref:hypothetical protein n=1 Tax=Roseobacter cerasinus TaxID=2602289 RepID=UPI00135B262C|nr:hypothetical protein [Roseobacter cerasinus]
MRAQFKPLSGAQNAKTAIREPASFMRQRTQPLAQSSIALLLLLVLKDGPVKISQLTRPLLADGLAIACPAMDAGQVLSHRLAYGIPEIRSGSARLSYEYVGFVVRTEPSPGPALMPGDGGDGSEPRRFWEPS